MIALVPFAGCLAEESREALASLDLPNLRALLAASTAEPPDAGEVDALSPPHERELARILGWTGGDGCLPWGAWLAEQAGLDAQDLAWGLLTPAHWHVDTQDVVMADPATLDLTPAEARALFETAADLLRPAGWLAVWGDPTRWFIAHESLAALPTASLDRVIGRNPDAWMPDAGAGRPFRRLQVEIQMAWHGHPINQARLQRGQVPVNSVWLSGCGVRPPDAPGVPAAALVVADILRAPALQGNWAAWRNAWRQLDAGPMAEWRARTRLGGPLRLVLCGERSAQGWVVQPRRRWLRWRPPAVDLPRVLAGL